jgi:parallel beta helix pectate lyase-like protein
MAPRFVPWLLLVALLLALPTPARATRIFVPKQQRTIQKAIDAASPGDTVWVGAGTYRGPFVLKKSIVLFGDEGPDSTILDGGDSVRVLHIEGVRGAGVIGFTIRRGHANSGGGISCVRDSSVMIATCLFEKNWETGLALWASEDINLSELQFVENTGGGLSVNASSVAMRQCAFVRNKANAGGAISLYESTTIFPVRGCRFEDNHADTAAGGAVYADSSQLLLADSMFLRNTSALAGGAVAVMRDSRSAITRCVFQENSAKASGALHADGSMLNVGQCIFDRNQSKAAASAIGYVRRAPSGLNATLANNTFYRNTSGEAATIWAEGASPEIRKNIFSLASGQRVTIGINSTPLYICNLIHDPSGAALASIPSVDTLVGDPLFCDPDHQNFKLRDLSPAALAACGTIGALPKGCASFKLVPSK